MDLPRSVWSSRVAITPALAQTGATTGLTGRVTDATGAALRGTSVTVQSVDTGAERVVNTNDQGAWEVRFLSPGTYVLTFELTGFKTLRRDGVTVSTAEMGTVDIVLEVGAITEAIDVTADAGMTSTSATLVRTLDRRELESLPTSGPQFHPASGDRARRLGRYQRAALERQRFDFAERERRTDHQQQLRLQRRRRDEPALLQQPGQRRARDDRRGRRDAVAQHRAGAGDARRGQAADESLRRLDGPQRRRQFPARLEERHQYA